jgi:hypothetical protein
MKTIIKIITILLLSITINSCGKKTLPPTTDVDGLPFATQTGANTFGCLIDGAPCSVTGEYNWLSGFGIEYTLGGGQFRIKVITTEPRKDFHIMCKLDSNVVSTHPANEYMNFGYTSVDLKGGTLLGSYYAIDSLPATVTITKYSGNPSIGRQNGDILSGTFDMVLQNDDGKKIHLTKGRFDITANK